MELPLTQNKVALVSAEDFEQLNAHKWHASKRRNGYYAARYCSALGTNVYLHRQIMGVESAGRAVFIDHINRDPLDNRRENLRLSNAHANAQNRRYSSNYSGLRGVRKSLFHKWEAQIGIDGKLIFLGSYETEREAGIAYAAACRAIGREI